MKKICLKILCALSAVCLLPFQSVKAEDPNHLTDDIISDYALIMSADTGQILGDKNGYEKMYPASMTKMLTCITALDLNPDLNETVEITPEILAGLKEANASVAGFEIGDTPSIQDLLYGSAIPSGADASNALAYHFAGSIDAYVDLMNQKAQEIGMTNSHFVNVTGLHDDNHYSTAYDISLLLQYCLKNDTFTKIFSSHDYTSSTGLSFRQTAWSLIDDGDYVLPAYRGGKTGFTDAAGHCMASWDEINGRTYIVVTGHAQTDLEIPSHMDDLYTILSHMTQLNMYSLMKKDTAIDGIVVKGPWTDKVVSVIAPEDFNYEAAEEPEAQITTDLPDHVSDSLEDQTYEGTITITSDNKVLHQCSVSVMIPKEDNSFLRLLLQIRDFFHQKINAAG